MGRPKNANEAAIQPEEHTVRLSDMKRLALDPGEALLIRFPRAMDGEAIIRAVTQIRDWLDEYRLDWPVLYSRDDVEYVVINQPEQKLGSRPSLGKVAADEEL